MVGEAWSWPRRCCVLWDVCVLNRGAGVTHSGFYPKLSLRDCLPTFLRIKETLEALDFQLRSLQALPGTVFQGLAALKSVKLQGSPCEQLPH